MHETRVISHDCPYSKFKIIHKESLETPLANITEKPLN